MRTTLEIDDGVLAAARAIADTERRSLGSVISDLARRGLVSDQRTTAGLPVFDVSSDAAPLTTELVHRALDE